MPKSSFQAGHAFDAGLAAFAALSAGFVAFAMPEPIFSSLVETSRLPQFVAAAQPPLGATARFAMVGAAALLTLVAVWALMAALDRVPKGAAESEPEAEAPRLRRADAHPDAPARRPLLARDLGEPLELDQPAEPLPESQPFPEAELRPLPGFLVPQAPEPEAEPEAEPVPTPIAALAGQLPETEPENDASLTQLVNRIESGLSRKRQALPASEPQAAEAPPAEAERVGHRLRSAITDLQRIAGAG